ncbi:transcriptional repressor LexA [Corynebacterium amycolatum]|uniref:transcriptional repressor LexA n=1 Tax=Corynebacterium amycolatum TaxID=43765 RepID=UPI003B5BF364
MAQKKKANPKTLTDRQRRILDVISDAVVLRGYPPSIREIGDAVGLNSTSSVAYQLKELEKKGFLRRDPHKPRAVNVRDSKSSAGTFTPVKPGPKATSSTQTPEMPEDMPEPIFVPIVGQIAAGNPILAEQHVESHMALPMEITGSGQLYLLKVVGDSMVDAGILDGDWVVVRSQDVVEQGDFVAALFEDEATVKEWHEDAAGKWLMPHNRAFDPLPAEHAKILGKIVSVLRSL